MLFVVVVVVVVVPRGKREKGRDRERERERRGGRIGKREAEIFGGFEDRRGKGWLCLPVKALGGCAKERAPSENTPQRNPDRAYIQLELHASLLQQWNSRANTWPNTYSQCGERAFLRERKENARDASRTSRRR